jgi:hypothetical protein
MCQRRPNALRKLHQEAFMAEIAPRIYNPQIVNDLQRRGRYTAAELKKLGVGGDLMTSIFEATGGPVTNANNERIRPQYWWSGTDGATESGQAAPNYTPTTDALQQLDGYTFDWAPGEKGAGSVVAYDKNGQKVYSGAQRGDNIMRDALDAGALAAAGFGGAALMGLGPLAGLGAAGGAAGAVDAGAGSSFLPAIGDAGGAGLLDGITLSTSEMMAGIPEFAATLTPATATSASIGAGLTGLGAAAAGGLDAGIAAGLDAATIGPGGAFGVSGVTGGAVEAAATGAAAKTGVGSWLANTLGTSGTTGDMLWNLGKAGVALAGSGAAANSLAPKVDTSGAAANTGTVQGIAAKQLALADEAGANMKAILEKYTPQIDQLLSTNLSAQQDSLKRANATWADYENTWKPAQQQYLQKATDWANPARMEAEAQRAASDTATQYDRAQAESERRLAMSGASPEKIAALQAAGGLTAAKAIGGASSLARRETEKTGMNLLGQAIGQGNTVAQQANTLSSLASQQGSAAQSGLSSAITMNSLPAQLQASLLSGAASTNNAATNSLLQQQQLETNATNARNAIFGDILGAGLGAIGSAGGLGKLLGG